MAKKIKTLKDGMVKQPRFTKKQLKEIIADENLLRGYVAKGVAYLDKELGLDWVHRIAVPQLNIENIKVCITGQLFGSFYNFEKLTSLSYDDIEQHGFRLEDESLYLSEGDAQKIDRYLVLSMIWAEVLRDLQKKRKKLA